MKNIFGYVSKGLLQILKKYAIVLVLIGIMIVFSAISPNFFTKTNLVNIFVQQSYVIIAAVGLAFVMIAGGMDLSIGYQISLVAVVTTMLMTRYGVSVPMAIIIAMVLGTILGICNGIASIKLKVHPLIITLGTMTVFQGISYILSNSNSFFNLDPSYKFIGQGYLYGIPFPVILMIVIALIGSFILNKTYFGRYVYALGGNEEAARLAGLNINAMKIVVFAICGFFVSIAAIVMTARAGSANSATGPGTEFTCMTAAILGGISFKGGEGKIWGLIVGVLILGVLSNGMQIINLGTYPQYIAKGIVLLAAVGFDTYQKSARVTKRNRHISSEAPKVTA
jgi:ribose/xylose/arabinose/galactoside ABC-type transport system permease subunit